LREHKVIFLTKGREMHENTAVTWGKGRSVGGKGQDNSYYKRRGVIYGSKADMRVKGWETDCLVPGARYGVISPTSENNEVEARGPELK